MSHHDSVFKIAKLSIDTDKSQFDRRSQQFRVSCDIFRKNSNNQNYDDSVFKDWLYFWLTLCVGFTVDKSGSYIPIIVSLPNHWLRISSNLMHSLHIYKLSHFYRNNLPKFIWNILFGICRFGSEALQQVIRDKSHLYYFFDYFDKYIILKKDLELLTWLGFLIYFLVKSFCLIFLG